MLTPTAKNFTHLLATLMLAHRKHERALALFQALAEADPSDAEIQHALSFTYGQMGRPRQALDHAERCLERAQPPLTRLAGMLKAKALWDLDRRDAAGQLFRDLVEHREVRS
jgi:tetratricopeptide (TPR) repeat protein